MKCPVCSKKHRTLEAAHKCRCKIEFSWGLYVIESGWKSYPDLKFDDLCNKEYQNREYFEKTKKLFGEMEEYMKQFNC